MMITYLIQYLYRLLPLRNCALLKYLSGLKDCKAYAVKYAFGCIVHFCDGGIMHYLHTIKRNKMETIFNNLGVFLNI